GRLHMTGALLLAPHLTAGNVAALLEAATHKTKEEIERLLAHCFPRPDLAEFVRPFACSPQAQGTPEPVSAPSGSKPMASDIPHAQGVSVGLLAPERVP